MQMLTSSQKKLHRAVLICPDQELGGQLERSLEDFPGLRLARRIAGYPKRAELLPVLRAHAPDVVFLSIEQLAEANETIANIQAAVEGIQIVAIDRVCNPPVLVELMRSGVREFIGQPFENQAMYEMLNRLNRTLDHSPPHHSATDKVFAFLSSKGGVGASTIAVNTSLALARAAGNDVLLADFDLGSGAIQFMLNLENQRSVFDAVNNALVMDEILWPKLVSKVQQLDVLSSGRPNPDFVPETTQIAALLDFLRRTYSVVCLDLSGKMERYSLDLLQEAKRVFLVCTPDLASLHHAREKHRVLATRDMGARVTVLMNPGFTPSRLTSTEMEKVLGLPIEMTFSSDPKAIHKALGASTCVDRSTELGKQYCLLAESMLRTDTPGPSKIRRMIEYFAIVPARYSLPTRRG